MELPRPSATVQQHAKVGAGDLPLPVQQGFKAQDLMGIDRPGGQQPPQISPRQIPVPGPCMDDGPATHQGLPDRSPGGRDGTQHLIDGLKGLIQVTQAALNPLQAEGGPGRLGTKVKGLGHQQGVGTPISLKGEENLKARLQSALALLGGQAPVLQPMDNELHTILGPKAGCNPCLPRGAQMSGARQ
jgi:hypothetical protein